MSYASVYGGAFAGPGINAPLGNVENTFYWDKHYLNIFDGGDFLSSTTDAGNTVTTVLRPGLLLGRVYSSGLLKAWNPTGTDGSQYIFGILDNPGMSMADSLGTAKQRHRGGIMVRGAVKPQRLLIPGQASFGIAGNAYEYLIRAQLNQRGFLVYNDPVSDSLLSSSKFFGSFSHLQAVTASTYTVQAYESGTLFTTRGGSGATFTLPSAVTMGLHYGFYNVADADLTVVCGGTQDRMVAINDPTADSVSFSTSALKVGGMFELISDGTGWLVRVSAGQTSNGTTSGQLVTVAS